MTSSLGPALPGYTSARTTPEQPIANGKKDDAGFGKMLGEAEGNARQDKQPTTETGSRQQNWARLAAGLSGHGSKDEPTAAAGKTTSAKMPTAKIAKDDTDEKSSKEDADALPLQDDLPLLMAFHDLRHFSTATKATGRDAASGDGSPNPALDGQATLPKSYRSKSTAGREALSESEQASLVDGRLTEIDGQPANAAGAASNTPKRGGTAMAQPLPDAPAAEVPGVQPKLGASVMKSIQDVQSSTRPEAGKQSLSGGRIDVVSEQSFPAPPQSPISQAALNVISAVTADGGPQKAVSASSQAAQLATPVAVPTHVLKIELHPAELGMVTAHLRLSGEQLSIELKPETHDAYRRLSADSDAIVKSLRGLGFEVDKVTILQPSVAVPAATRTDATSSLPAATGRDPSSFQPGNSGGNNGGTGGQQPGRNHSDDAQEFGRAASPARERAGGDMFI